MNKLISKIVGVCLGLSLATGVGVGVAVGQNSVQETRAVTSTYVWNPTAKLSSGDSTVDTVEWNVTSGNFQNYSKDYSGVQIGTSNSPSYLTCYTTSNFSYNSKTLIKRVTLYANTGGSATITLKVGGTTVINAASVAKKSNISSYTAASKHEYTSSSGVTGAIEFTLNGTSKACYFCAIEVEVDSGSSATLSSITASLTNGTKVWKKNEVVTATDVTVVAHYSDSTTQTISNGAGVTITNGTLGAGNNTVTVGFGGKTTTISVFAKAPTSITTAPANGSSTSLNANGADYIETSISYHVSYNNDTTDYGVSFSCDTAGWIKKSDSNGEAVLRFESNGTYQFTLSANDDSDVAASFTFVVTGIPNIEYSLFENDIEEGNYVFIDSTKTYVMSNTTSNSRVQNGNLPTITNDKIMSPASAYVWHFSQVDSYWVIQNVENEKYLAATNSNNQAALISEITDNAKWIISFDETDGFTFENYGRSASTNKYLKNNGTYGWACYAIATGNKPLLYKLADDRPLISMTCNSLALELGGEDVDLVVKNSDTGEIITDVNVSVEDETIVSYSNGKVHALSKGETTLVISKEATETVRYETFSANVVVAEFTPISSFFDGTIDVSSTTSEAYTFKGTCIGIIGNSYYLQDGNYGIYVYNYPVSNLKVGSLVAVTSNITTYNTLVETASPSFASVLGTGNLPAANIVNIVSGFAGTQQSTYVTFMDIKGGSISWSQDFASGSKDGIGTAQDKDGNTISIYVSRHLNAKGTAIVEKLATLVSTDTFDIAKGVKAINTANSATDRNQLSIMDADQITIHHAGEDRVQSWIDEYLYMNDSSFSGNGTGRCLDDNLYLTAKRALIALGNENVSKFQNNTDSLYTAALARYNAWASACGDTSPFAGNNIVPASRAFFNIDSNSAAIPAIVVVIALATVTTGAYFFLRKKKEN